MNIKIKICGITRKEDAQLAAELGAWATGFIFAENTPRYVSPEKVSEMIKVLPANMQKFGVFVNASSEDVKNIALKIGLTKIQLHGEESPEYCEKLREITGLEIVKAIRIKNENSLEIIENYKGKTDFILLDSFSEKARGGTGKTVERKLAIKAKEYGIPIILAGGLNPDNAKEIYEEVQPYALDISSGVEADKGIKDGNKLESLFTNLR